MAKRMESITAVGEKRPRAQITDDEVKFFVKAYRLGITSRTKLSQKLKNYRVSREDAKNIQRTLDPVVSSLVDVVLAKLADMNFVINEYNYAFVAFYIGRTLERELGKRLFEILVEAGGTE